MPTSLVDRFGFDVQIGVGLIRSAVATISFQPKMDGFGADFIQQVHELLIARLALCRISVAARGGGALKCCDSRDPDQEYFADSITDDLTTDLSGVPGSFVIARSTAFTYKGRAVEAKQIGREVGVRYVLEGSVRRSGNQVRVNAQLIDAETARICGCSGSTAIRAISSLCKMRSRAGSQLRST